MSLEIDIQAAYEAQEAVETTAREVELEFAKSTVLQGFCQCVRMGNLLIVRLLPSR